MNKANTRTKTECWETNTFCFIKTVYDTFYWGYVLMRSRGRILYLKETAESYDNNSDAPSRSMISQIDYFHLCRWFYRPQPSHVFHKKLRITENCNYVTARHFFLNGNSNFFILFTLAKKCYMSNTCSVKNLIF